MPSFKDYTGEKINNWKMLKHIGFNKHGESLWLAECDCKNKTTEERVLSSFKRFGECKKCVQDKKLENKKKSTIGSKYGKLTIVDYCGYRDDVATKNPFWIAKCDCGSSKEIVATLYDIERGRISSCGCAKLKEVDFNIIGKKFGRLTVKGFLRKNNKYQHEWECICDCGTDNVVTTTALLESGFKKSCGCLQNEVVSITGNIGDSKRKKYNKFIEKNDYYIGITDNGEFFFDKDDYNKIISINKYWKINNAGYVLCSMGGEEYQLHRYLMGLGKYDYKNNIIVDHINGDKLDNRKSNLRICQKDKNPKNCTLYSNNTSGHKGVSWNERLLKWQVSIQADNDLIYLGIYSDLNEAVEVRKNAEIQYFGEFSRDYRNEVIAND